MWARKSQTFVSHNKKFYSNVSYHHCLLFSMRGTVAVVDQTTDAFNFTPAVYEQQTTTYFNPNPPSPRLADPCHFLTTHILVNWQK